MSEVWKDVPGYEGKYQVSDHGNVRSVDRLVPHPLTKHKRRKGIPLKQNRNNQERLVVRLCGKTFYVHTLVALAFLGPKPEGLMVAHLDGNKDINVPQNLMYATARENSQHRVYHGGRLATPEIVRTVRGTDTSANGALKALAANLGLPKQVIVNIKNGSCYSHVQ